MGFKNYVLVFLSLVAASALYAGVCGTGTLQTTFNPFTGKLDYVCVSTGTGGGSPGGSNTNVQFNSTGTFGGDNGFQYDSSVSSVTLAGQFGLTTGSNNILLQNVGGNPNLILDNASGSPGADIRFRSFGTDTSRISAAAGTFSFYNATGNALTPIVLQQFRTTQTTFNNASGTSIFGLDYIGNSTFTIPVLISTLTINRQLKDSTGSAGSSGQLFTSNGSSPPSWQTASSGSSIYKATSTAGFPFGASFSTITIGTPESSAQAMLSYSTISARLEISTHVFVNGVLTTSGTISGMSTISRGLTVNTSGFNTIGSSSEFIVNGGGLGSAVRRFTVDPINDIIISSAPHKMVSTTTINGAVIDGASTAGTSGQVYTSRGNGLAPTWQTGSSGDMVLASTQNSTGAKTWSSYSNFIGTSVFNAPVAIVTSSTLTYSMSVATTATGPYLINVDTNSHVNFQTAVASATNCGTTPVLTGSGNAFSVTPGGGSPGSCLVTFAKPFKSKPSCVVTAPGQSTSFFDTYATTAQSLTVTVSGILTTVQPFDAICFGSD